MNDEILKLYETKNSIQSRLNNLKKNLAITHFEEIQVLDLYERPCVMVRDRNLPDDYVDYYLVKYMHSRQKMVETIGACDCYTLDIQNSNPESQYYLTKNLFFYSDSITYQSNYTLPAGKYLSLVYRGPSSRTKQFVPMLFEYAKVHKLKVLDDPIEFCLIDEYETASEEECITELQLAVN